MNHFLYVGTYGAGIYGFRFDPAGSKLEPLGLVAALVNPSFLATSPQHRFLYAVSELEGNVEGAVASFAIDRHTGSLKLLNSMPSGGEAPCHLAADATARLLVVANYGTGSVAAFPIEHDGRLGTASCIMTATGSSVNPERQEGPHAHQAVISPDNRFLYVPDLGLDQIRIYRLDAANTRLVQNDPAFVTGRPGAGPRHIAFHPQYPFAYLLNELDSTITVFSHDRGSGDLISRQHVTTLPPDFAASNLASEIEVDSTGQFVYASNRGHDSIAVFAIGNSGTALKLIEIVSSQGKYPRAFKIDPTGRFLFVGAQKSDQAVIFTRDAADGKIAPTAERFDMPSPVCFVFVPQNV